MKSLKEAFVKGVTYGGTVCKGGCFMGKEGLKKIIKISKELPNNVFMFRDDNYSGLQPHFIKNGVVAKANTIGNPSYDLERHKVRNLNIGKDVILSVRLFEGVNESIKESELKGYLAADVVDDIVKTLGSKMVKGHVENAPNRNYIYLKLTDIKFGNDVVKMLKSKFGIDAKLDKTFGNIPTVSFASKKVVSEKKSDYEVYHKSYTSAIEAAREYAEKKGYEINNDDAFTQIGMGPRKPSEGKTNRFDIELSKDGKVQRKKLQIQVYGMRNSYELNAYIQ